MTPRRGRSDYAARLDDDDDHDDDDVYGDNDDDENDDDAFYSDYAKATMAKTMAMVSGRGWCPLDVAGAIWM